LPTRTSFEDVTPMWAFVIATGSTVVLAAAVAVFVAWPSRGREIPRVEWLNGAVAKAAQHLPDELAEEFVAARR
jgi:UDP:flavonoid glycosyltransferase YjiC (YdhE family)